MEGKNLTVEFPARPKGRFPLPRFLALFKWRGGFLGLCRRPALFCTRVGGPRAMTLMLNFVHRCRCQEVK